MSKVGVAILLSVSAGQAEVIITEVAMKAQTDWVEIYNSGLQSVDISGFMLTDLDGTDTPFASAPTTLPPGAYAVIHWSQGTDETDEVGDLFPPNGYIDLYVDDKELTGTDDQVVLHNGTLFIDAVIWSDNSGGGVVYELDDFNLLAPDLWNCQDISDWIEYDSCAWTDSDQIGSDQSLARYLDPTNNGYVDTNRKENWY
ncbi:MAG: lamin tail domain-containing protein, partial [bacterium]